MGRALDGAELEGSGAKRGPARVRFEVETGQRRRTIEVRRSGGGWTVTMDGRLISVDLTRGSDRWSRLGRSGEGDQGASGQASEPASVHASSYDLAVESRRQGRHIVHVG